MIAMVDSEYLQDKKVQKIDSDIRQFEVDLQKVKLELEGLDRRHDGEIESYRSVAKSRRDTYEDLLGRVRKAEQEWKTADKDYKDAKKRKDSTRSNLEKQIDTLKKRIKNAEKTKYKRFEELDKEKARLRDK